MMRCEFIIKDNNKPSEKTCKICGRIIVTDSTVESIRANCKTPENQMIKEHIGLTAKAINFGKAMVGAIKDGELCTQEQIDVRMNICKACEFLIIKQQEPFKGECNKCGCNCNSNRILLNKTAIPSQECPIGKWGKIEV